MIQSPQVLGFEMNVFARKTERETEVFKWNKSFGKWIITSTLVALLLTIGRKSDWHSRNSFLWH